ncbi:insulinase family protein [Arenibacter sp. M-2]|uniref:M16 family metallopeptidase n=1 Tax=Arenibacter sp. M-2 TaxID=3053612 RepID=UPI00257005FE|nr:insulinase family protein [Arenibacter sp. M-2]MDL5514010.1 insulinase family protein [Arenibacter sp. M-2]
MKHCTKHIIPIIIFNLFYLSVIGSIMGSPLKDSALMDPDIRYGHLPNGFTYYLKHVPTAPKIYMDLYVKVGSYHASPDELQFPHLLEHLAFKTAKHFPINLLDDPELKNRFGIERYDIRASASLLYTKYYFNVPQDRMDALDQGLLWFRDIADLDLDIGAIDRERGPLRQEAGFRAGNDINGFMLRKKMESGIFPCQKDFSGFYEHLENFKTTSLIQFYRDWYIPERMGLVIVGNINDIDSVAQKIIGRFSDIPAKKSRPSMEVDCKYDYLRGPNRFVSLERKKEKGRILKNNAAWHLYFKDKGFYDENGAFETIKRNVLWQILGTLINNRIQFDSLVSGIATVPKPEKPYFNLNFVDYDGSIKQKLQKIVQLFHQAKVFGFKEEEWTSVQSGLLSQLKDTTSASYWKDQLFLHFMGWEALPAKKGISVYDWAKRLTIQDINTFTKEKLSNKPDDIGIIAPSGHKDLDITKVQVRGWIDQAGDALIKPYIPPRTKDFGPLMPKEQIAGLRKVKVADQRVKNKGVDELVLENGVKVVIHSTKPFGRLKDRISIHGFSPYGASCFLEDDYFSAINAPSIVQEAGVGNFDGEKLRHVLAETSFSGTMRPYINFDETGFRVNGTYGDLEKMLQLVYLYFNQPRNNLGSFDSWKKKERNRYLYPSYGLMYEDFDRAINEVLKDRSSVPLGTTRYKGIALTDRKKSFTIFQDLYSNASAFTFIISGDLSKESVVPLAQKYLGNLIGSNPNFCEKDDQVNGPYPKGPIYREFSAKEIGASYEMKSVQYSLQFVIREMKSLDWKELIKVKALGVLINSKLREFRYQKEAALYDFSAFGGYNGYLESYRIGIYLDCMEEELEWLREESKLMVAEIKKDGFSPERFKQICTDVLYPMFEATSTSNLAAKNIYEHYRYGYPLVDNASKERFIKSLTIEDLKKTARKYLSEGDMMEFVMRENRNDP